ncbi:MAG: aminoacyl-tRNA deacylase [Chloroflexi bacterium]|nr:aminoacyl-tRNA deacylase [Chloroflexota bacterium]
MAKLNSMRLLERSNIDYVVHEFDDSIHSADRVAAVLGIDLHRVYKTLVVMPDDKNARGRPMLVLLSAGRELDLKAMAQAADMKKVRMAGHDEAEKLTGLKVGGISPLMLTNKNWPVFIDARAVDLDWILLSAGQRGMNLQVNVVDLIRVLDIQPVDVARDM